MQRYANIRLRLTELGVRRWGQIVTNTCLYGVYELCGTADAASVVGEGTTSGSCEDSPSAASSSSSSAIISSFKDHEQETVERRVDDIPSP